MYAVEVVTPPAGVPVTAGQLRDRLRLNDQGEDEQLAELLAGAVDLFEEDAKRPVLATVYRQHLSRWPYCYRSWPEWVASTDAGRIPLMRGGVTAIAGVYRNLADGTAEALTGWAADLRTPPARVRLAAEPDQVLTAAGLVVEPVGYVEFTAGWENPAAVPAIVRTAIMLLAGHWYENREAYREKALVENEQGWGRVVRKYKLGLSGDWGL